MQSISVSGEPSGLQFYAHMPQEEWKTWIDLFKERATKILGFAAGELEDGYDLNGI